jgi:hypothetical protein
VSDIWRPNRRNMLAHVTALLSTVAMPAGAQSRKPGDNGIGGTGYSPTSSERDNGIGGTGVVGTIRRFGSIVVNNMRIGYGVDATVTIDGQPARAADMRIGHIVSLIAETSAAGLSTRAIEIVRDVVGPLESINGRRLVVLGQSVVLGKGVKAPRASIGGMVAVSGLRMSDQTIAATLVEPAPDRAMQIVGLLQQTDGGRLAIAGQRIDGLTAASVGQRLRVAGALNGDVFEAREATVEPLAPEGVTRLSVEVYVQREGDRLVTPSGVDIAGAGHAIVRAARAILSVDVRSEREWTLNSLEVLDRSPQIPSMPAPGGGMTPGPRGMGGPSGGPPPAGPGRGGPGPGGGMAPGPHGMGGPSGGPGPGGIAPPGGPIGPGGPMGPGGMGGPGGGFGGPGGFGGMGGGPGGGRR